MVDLFLQKDFIDYFKQKLGTENWVPLYREDISQNEKLVITIKCVLVQKKKTKSFLSDPFWSLPLGVGPENHYWCNSYSKPYEGVLPIAYEQTFNNLHDSIFHLSEDFTMLFNCFLEDDESFYAVTETGDEKIVEKKDDFWFIRKEILYRYAAARKMNICFLVATLFNSSLSLGERKLKEKNIKKKERFSSFCFLTQDMEPLSDVSSFSKFVGKKIIPCPPIQQCGFGNYTDKKYCDFIIGLDDKGQQITASCNENHLFSRAAGENTHKLVDYLTPVFFDKRALSKYYQDARYKVSESYLSYGDFWGTEIDICEDEFSIYLGDLGRDVPYQEQLYLKSFNITGSGTVSKERFLRDNLCVFTEPKNKDSIFSQAKELLNDKWKVRFGWDLFLPLMKGDEHCITDIHSSLTNQQEEFDVFISSLTKVLIDSLNENQIQSQITTSIPKDARGIKKLRILFLQENLDPSNSFGQYLVDLYNLRDRTSAHRKSEETVKAEKKLGLDGKSFTEKTEIMLQKSIEFCNGLCARLYVQHSFPSDTK